MPGKPSLDLNVSVTDAQGVVRQWAGPKAENVPQGLSFRTKKGDGFADASVTLSRRIDRDWVDLNLYDDVVINGTDGSIAYEGRIGALPRSMQDAHTVTVQIAGWMSHARDRKFSDVFVDRDLSRWAGPSVQRTANLILITHQNTGNSGAVQDPTGYGAVAQTVTGVWPTGGRNESWYDAGTGIVIGSVYYSFKLNGNINVADTAWNWQAFLSTDDLASSFDNTANLRATTGSGTLTATTATKRYAMVLLEWVANVGATGVDYTVFWRPAVYGTSGIATVAAVTSGDPPGVLASDVIKNVAARFCPKLNTAGVQATTYPIPHVVFRDRTDPYDAFLEVNKYHLWQLGVYDNKTLHYGPVDMSGYDWEVRLSDPGTKLELQGDSTQDLANGIVVTYQDVATGKQNTLTPDAHPELLDSSATNPANQHGITAWTETTLSSPTTSDAALQFGRAALAEFNQPKAPGTVTVQGHIRDRAGHWQPVWKVRAGDRLIISDHPNSSVRLVAETDYQHDSRQIAIAVDSAFLRMDAVMHRQEVALAAAGLSS